MRAAALDAARMGCPLRQLQQERTLRGVRRREAGVICGNGVVNLNSVVAAQEAVALHSGGRAAHMGGSERLAVGWQDGRVRARLRLLPLLQTHQPRPAKRGIHEIHLVEAVTQGEVTQVRSKAAWTASVPCGRTKELFCPVKLRACVDLQAWPCKHHTTHVHISGSTRTSWSQWSQ
jgi:hypothetical protein